MRHSGGCIGRVRVYRAGCRRDNFVCIYIYIYMYVCMYIYIHTHISGVCRASGVGSMGVAGRCSLPARVCVDVRYCAPCTQHLYP